MAMNNKKILAVWISAVLTVGFLVPSLMNAQAQVSSESRVLNTILALTEDINRKAQTVHNNLDNIDDDLLLKQKFWQHKWRVSNVGWDIGVWSQGCEFDDPSACAFNVESIQLRGSGEVEAIWVDGVRVDVTGKDIVLSSNVLTDIGVGKVGANRYVMLECGKDASTLCSADVEFNGEKPQGLFLWRFRVLMPTTDTLLVIECIKPEFQIGSETTRCPDELVEDIRRTFPVDQD
jgi:hypothetical protein